MSQDMKTSTEILREHFEELKKSVPEVYAQNATPPEETKEDKLYALIRKTLNIIEAVYFQSKENFTFTRAEEYDKVVKELQELGFSYEANRELLEKSATAALMRAKLPMEKATGVNRDSSKKVG